MDWTMTGLVNNVQHSRSPSFSSTASNTRASIATLSEGASSSDPHGISSSLPITHGSPMPHTSNNALLDSLYEQLAVMHAKHSQREHQRTHSITSFPLVFYSAKTN